MTKSYKPHDFAIANQIAKDENKTLHEAAKQYRKENGMMDNDERARKIAKKVFEDILDRKGIGNELEECDDDIQKEIKNDWKKIILKVLEEK